MTSLNTKINIKSSAFILFIILIAVSIIFITSTKYFKDMKASLFNVEKTETFDLIK